MNLEKVGFSEGGKKKRKYKLGCLDRGSFPFPSVCHSRSFIHNLTVAYLFRNSGGISICWMVTSNTWPVSTAAHTHYFHLLHQTVHSQTNPLLNSKRIPLINRPPPPRPPSPKTQTFSYEWPWLCQD